jgi:hypothetical protein
MHNSTLRPTKQLEYTGFRRTLAETRAKRFRRPLRHFSVRTNSLTTFLTGIPSCCDALSLQKATHALKAPAAKPRTAIHNDVSRRN